MTVESAVLAPDNPITVLMRKAAEFLTSQPEWGIIIELPRQERRAAMKELAQRLYTLPIMDGLNTIPRQMRRKAAKQLGNLAKDIARKEVTQAIGLRQEQLLQAAAALGYEAAQREAEVLVSQELADPGETSVVDHVQEDGTEIWTFPPSEEATALAAEDLKALEEGDESSTLLE